MSLLDKAIAYFSPERALRRARAQYQMRIYEAAMPGRRANSWRSRGLSQNSELMGAIGPLRDRARNMSRNSPWAPRMLDIITAHTVGTGLRPVSNTGDDKLDVKVMKLWEEWNAQADIEGNLTFDAMQSLALRSIIESGEVVLRHIEQPMRRNRDAAVPLKVQLLEGDYIDHQRDGLGYGLPSTGLTPDTKRSRLGVGLGEWDRRTGLWLFPYHPGEMTTVDLKAYLSEFVPQDEITHVFRAVRPGQVRGVSWFAPMLMMAGDLADFMDALIMKAKVEACFSAFVTNTNEFEEVMSASPAASGLSPSAANPDAEMTTLEPGMIKELKQGQDIKFAQPTGAQQVEPMLMYPLMAMAAAVGATYDQLSGDLRGANYSSLRAGKIDFRRLVEQSQNHMVIPRFCLPVWRKFIARAIMAGELPEHESNYPVNWVTPAWESINPKFDQNAEELSVRAGRMPPQEFIASWGYDWRDVQDQFKAFFDRADKLGLKFDIDPRTMTKAGSFQPVPKDPNAPAPSGGGSGKMNGSANGSGMLTDANGNEIDLQDLQDLLDAAGEGGRGFPFTDSPLVAAAFCLIAKRYSDDQPRDESGRWTDGGASEAGGGGSAPPAGGAIESGVAAKAAGSPWTWEGGPHGERWQEVAQKAVDAWHDDHPRIEAKTLALKKDLDAAMADAVHYTDYRDWYDDHKPLAREIFGEYEPMFEKFLAATSINTAGEQNVNLAVRATIHYMGGGKFNTVKQFPGVLGVVRKQLKAAVEGQPMHGPKVEAFAANLGGDLSRVTMDRHMKDLLFRHPREGGGESSRPQSEAGEAVIQAIAAKMDWKPAQLQAVLWAVDKARMESGLSATMFTYKQYLEARAAKIRTLIEKQKASKRSDVVGTLEKVAAAFEGAVVFLNFVEAIKRAFPALTEIREYNEEDHPRDELGRWTDAGGADSGAGVDAGAGAGGSSPASAKTGSVGSAAQEHETGYEFVSPNVEAHLDFGEAVAAIGGEQQQALHAASVYINEELGVGAVEHDIIGAWADGAENSVMDIVGDADWDKLRLAAAMKGWLADQKSVLVFQQQDGAGQALYHFEAKGDLDKIHAGLIEDGVSFHTLVPHDGGATVYVADLDGSMMDAVEKGAQRHDAEVIYEEGRAEFIGDSDGAGTDREQRDRARAAYEAVVAKSPVQEGREIWDRVRDRWGEGLVAGQQKRGGPATDKLREFVGLSDDTGTADGTGFLAPDGTTLMQQVGINSHNQIAKAAGTSLNSVLSEGTARLFAHQGLLGVEIRQSPTRAQVAKLVEFAKTGRFDSFVIETTWLGRPDTYFRGEVTPRAVRETIAKAFPPGARGTREWDEADHPRDESGKFTAGGGGEGGGKGAGKGGGGGKAAGHKVSAPKIEPDKLGDMQEVEYAKNEMNQWFPNVGYENIRVDGPATPEYNCIAWAFGDTSRPWWPGRASGDHPAYFYWPNDDDVSVEAFDHLLIGELGGSVTEDQKPERGHIKLALYAKEGDAIDATPTHLSRQLKSGEWSSKVGQEHLVRHGTDVTRTNGGGYGDVIKMYSVPEAAWRKLKDMST